MTKIIMLISIALLTLGGICSFMYFPNFQQKIAEKYLKDKIVNEYKNVAKQLDLNNSSETKDLVDNVLKKINILSLDLASENQKLKEENKKLHDMLTQKAENIKGMLR